MAPYNGLTKEQIERSMKHTQSCRAAAKYLGVTVVTFKKYASMYIDEESGVSLYERQMNQNGIGIKKVLKTDPKRENDILMDILSGVVIPSNYDASKLKSKLISEALLKEECAWCGFHEQRLSDYKVPLLITFRDGDKRNWKFDNLELLCYNCYFLRVGNIFTRKQIAAIEDMYRPRDTDLKEELQIEDHHAHLLDEEIRKHHQIYEPPDEDLTGESLIFKR